MKTIAVSAIAALASALAMGSAAAQPAPFNELGLTMGHWHIISKDSEANKKIFLAMGGKLFLPGGAPLMMFPGIYINLTLSNEKGDGGSQGSVVNHVGDRKSTRLNSSHLGISYAVFCLKKKKNNN